MAYRRRQQPGGRKPGRPKDTSGFRPAKESTSGFRPRQLGRVRNLLQQLDADQLYRRWREGMTIAFSRAGELAGQARTVSLLALRPWSTENGLELRPATQLLFPSTLSPDGAWTVTVEPRDGPLTTEPLGLLNQQEVQLQVGGPDSPVLRLLEVAVRADLTANGTWSARGLLGELVEDSLLLDVSEAPEMLDRGAYRFRPDQEVKLMMVVGADPEAGLIYLDGRRRWRRRPRGDFGGVQLVEEPIADGEDLFLGRSDVETWLCSSSTFACNCPDFLGLQLQDWRSGKGLGGSGQLPVAGPFSPARRDVTNEIARVYRLLAWERNPVDSCKHVHAARWLLGCPVAEPGDAPPPGDDYWKAGKTMADLEEFPSPFRPGESLDIISSMDRWRGLSGLLPAISAGDALALTVYELQLYRGAGSGLLLLPLEGISTDPALAPVVSGDDVVIDRFNRLWPTEDRFFTNGTVGDVWVGTGTAPEAYPYQADGEPADTPFITDDPLGTVPEP